MFKINNMWFIILLTVIALSYDNNFTFSNKYLTVTSYQIVDVHNGDSLWTISSKFVTDKDDIRHLVAAIKYLNKLDNDTQIHPGQLLKIPVVQKDIKYAQKEN